MWLVSNHHYPLFIILVYGEAYLQLQNCACYAEKSRQLSEQCSSILTAYPQSPKAPPQLLDKLVVRPQIMKEVMLVSTGKVKLHTVQHLIFIQYISLIHTKTTKPSSCTSASASKNHTRATTTHQQPSTYGRMGINSEIAEMKMISFALFPFYDKNANTLKLWS